MIYLTREFSFTDEVIKQLIVIYLLFDNHMTYKLLVDSM